MQNNTSNNPANSNESITLVSKMAKEFGDALRNEIGTHNLQLVNKLNAVEKISGVCHSHDFCDANEVLAEVFANNGYPEINPADEKLAELWGKVWDAAKDLNFGCK